MVMNQKPFVSFCIFTYNQENYILDAINGAVNQEYDNMEIIISDDNSKDNTYEIIQDYFAKYNGKHKIVLNRNNTNLGIREHFNKVIYTIAKGDIIIIAAGDDVSLPNRTEVTVDFFNSNPQINSLHFLSLQVDEKLTPILNRNINLSKGLHSIITLDDYIQSSIWLYSGDSRAFRRELIEKFPKLEYSHNEDIPTFIRSIILGSTALIRNNLVLRRIDGKNTSLQWRYKQEGKDLYKQIFKDVNFALDNNYIDKITAEKILYKIENIIVDMKFLDLERLCPIITKLYNLFIYLPRYIARKI